MRFILAHWHSSLTFSPLVLLLQLQPFCPKEQEEGKAEGNLWFAINIHLESTENPEPLRASIPGYFRQWLATWSFKPWIISCISTREKCILKSNFSCMKWRKTLPGSKYLLHQKGMHPSRPDESKKLPLGPGRHLSPRPEQPDYGSISINSW